MQASIDKLIEALAAKLSADVPPPTHPAAILTPEPSGISQAVHTNESAKDVPEHEQPSSQEVAALPTTTTETASPKPAATTEAVQSSETEPEPEPAVEPVTPKSPIVKKHVKRSSFFGGFFG